MGPTCKHEVAVYYIIRDEILDGKKENEERKTGEERIKRLLDKLTKEGLMTIIIERALDNDKFSNYLIARYEIPGKNGK